ncbi:MAG: hypothetical protein ABI548_17860 [Polyangiaceae bacterium]
MNRLTSSLIWMLLVGALPAVGCVLVQPLESAVSDDNSSAAAGSDDSSAAAGSDDSSAGAKGSAGKSSGSSGATGSAGRGSSGSSSGGGTATGNALFIGTWTITSGSTTVDCTGTPTTDPLTGNDIWAAGTDSDLVLDPDTSCPIKADITDRTASAQPGFTCTTSGTDSSGSPYTSVLKADDYSFVVSSNGKTATGMLSGTATYTEDGTSVPCTFSEQADYTKN